MPVRGFVAFLWLSLASADDIILTSGEVVEGKLDQEATSAANKGKTNPADIVMVVVVDEAGTRKTYKHSEVKFIVSKKPPWELRKENLQWYEKESPKVKEVAPAQEAFARQCRARGLEDQALVHYRIALEARRKTLSPNSDERLKLAEWCRKAGLLEDEQKELEAAIEIKKADAKKSPKPIKVLLDLAASLQRKQLFAQATAIYQEILAAEPDNASAMAGVKSIRDATGADMKELVDLFIQKNHAWKIKVAIEDNADPAFLKDFEARLKLVSEFLFEITEGQFFIYEWEVQDQTSNGQLIIEKGKIAWTARDSATGNGVLATTIGIGVPNWTIRAPGKVSVNTLVHELFHAIFGLLDEYHQNPQCPCVMKSQPSPQRLCTPETHKGGGRQPEPCVNTIKKRFPESRFPNPDWKGTFVPPAKSGVNRGATEEVEGELTFQGKKLTQPPMCKVAVIDR